MIINKEIWNSYVKKNKDPYGKCCVDVARKAMELLDKEILKDFDPNKLIIDAEYELIKEKKMREEESITGFMAGCVAQMISKCHSRGDEFKKKWNESYGVKDEKKGAINPALVTIEFNEKEECFQK